ncbi:hypothetical protein PG989_000062 [Apiospora arundinis]
MSQAHILEPFFWDDALPLPPVYRGDRRDKYHCNSLRGPRREIGLLTHPTDVVRTMRSAY